MTERTRPSIQFSQEQLRLTRYPGRDSFQFSGRFLDPHQQLHAKLITSPVGFRLMGRVMSATHPPVLSIYYQLAINCE